MPQINIALALAKQVIEGHKNKQFLTEEDIYWSLMGLGQKQPMYLKVINALESLGYVKVIYNTEEVDEFGDGSIYTPSKNQDCNEYEEWAWLSKTNN